MTGSQQIRPRYPGCLPGTHAQLQCHAMGVGGAPQWAHPAGAIAQHLGPDSLVLKLDLSKVLEEHGVSLPPARWDWIGPMVTRSSGPWGRGPHSSARSGGNALRGADSDVGHRHRYHARAGVVASGGTPMQFETSVEIYAPLERVWDTLMELERWPEWTPSITRVERLNSSGFGLGSRVRIKQPRMPSMLWEVTEFRGASNFAWESTSGGVTTVATHALTRVEADRVVATLGVRQSGVLAPVVGLLTARTARRCVQMEADGLKRRSEAR